LAVVYTMRDFRRDYIKEHLPELTPEERLAGLSAEQVLAGLSTEQILASLSAEQIREYLDRVTAGHKIRSHRPRPKK
jgi:hypothetical protein